MVTQAKRREQKLKAAKFDPQSIKNGRMQVPRAALRFAGVVQFSDDGQPTAEGTIPISLVARSGNAILHWWFGKCIHDLDGMEPAAAKLALDYCHRDDEVLGYSDNQEVTDDGLVMHGVLIPFKKHDRVDEVVSKAAAGMEWQASIYFDSDNMVLEFVPDGMSVEVNGQDFEGPGVVFRQWILRGAAVCPHGYDPQTSVQLSKSGDNVAVSFQELNKMATKPKKKTGKLGNPAPNRHERRKAAALAAKPTAKGKGKLATVKPVAKPAKPSKLVADDGDDEEEELEADDEEMDDDDGDGTETEGDCDCAGEDGCECDEEDEGEEEELEADDDVGEQSAKKGGKGKLSPAQQEAKRFVDAFGDVGGRWYAEGMSFQKAQVKFNKRVRKENTALQNKVDEQAAQLAALRGEEEPLSGGEGKPAAKKPMNGLSAGQSKFASTLTMPSATAPRK